MCEIMLVLLIANILQAIYLTKYRPYYLANTRPELFLKKYIQYLIKHTQKFAKGFNKPAEEGDETAIETLQHMTARLNWLVLEREFVTTINPDIRYWEDINIRIGNMLKNWKEVKFITEPPEVAAIKLAINGNPVDFDFENADIDQSVKDHISALKKKVYTMSRYQSMYNEMEAAYQTLEASYKDLRSTVVDLKVEVEEAEKLKSIIAEHEAADASLEAMLAEIENSKERLNEELNQLEDAYVELERGTGNISALQNSDNPDAQEMVAILDQQKTIFEAFKKTLDTLNLKPAQKEKIESHATEMSKTHNEINHSMQMLEIERERLEDEVKMMQADLEVDD